VTALGRTRAEATAAWRSFLRRRTAVFFTFFFPVLLVLIFGALVGTRPTGGGLFAEPPGYYVAGYLAVVVLFTPLSRVGSEVARHRDGNRFEKLATTPLTRPEWLLAHALVTGAVIGVSPALALLAPFVALAVALFCGLGALLGRLADSADGVVAASNAVALPLLFLSETFVTPGLLPAWFRPVVGLSPLTYFARGARIVTYGRAGPVGVLPALGWPGALAVLTVLAVAFFAAGAYALPRTD
jgi:ABC-2 type transport system permease protein